MARSSARDHLTQELPRFEAAMREIARAIVREVFAQELARRTVDQVEQVKQFERGQQVERGKATRVARVARIARIARIAKIDGGLPELERGLPELERATIAQIASPIAAVAVAPKRRGWTRELVIDELSTWLLSGTAVEASFVRRHGQPGLAAAAKRLFGRFDAALNAANLHLAQRYPDGPPTKKSKA